jgi:hypothetical protein
MTMKINQVPLMPNIRSPLDRTRYRLTLARLRGDDQSVGLNLADDKLTADR